MPECTRSFDPQQALQATVDAAKDAAYVGIGFAVLGAKQAQDRLSKLQADLERERARRADAGRSAVEDATGRTRSAVTDGVKQAGSGLKSQLQDVDTRIAPLAGKVDTLLDQVEATLPEGARAPVSKAREAARKATTDVRTRLGLADEAGEPVAV